MNAVHRGCLASPIGIVEVRVNDRGAVTAVSFVDDSDLVVGETGDACAQAVRQLEEYFQSERRRFLLELEPEGTDLVQLPALPEQRGTVSALTPHVETIAERPPSSDLRDSSDEHAMVAEAF